MCLHQKATPTWPSVFGNSNEVWAQDGNNDLAGVFGNSLDTTANGANYLVDVLPSS